MASLTSQLLVRLIDGVSGPARNASNSLKGIGNAARGISGMQMRLSSAIEKNNAALANARGRMVDAAAAGYVLARALAAPVKAAMDFESSMSDVRKVVNFATPAAFKDFQRGVIEMSKRIPMAASDLSKIIAAAGQAGVAGDDLMKFTEMAAKVGVAFDISADQAGDSLVKMMTGMQMTIPQVSLLADAMNALSNAQASDAAGILDVVRRVGAQSKQFGFNAVQVSAFASAMLSAGAESDVAATSFRNMGLALTKGSAVTKGQRAAYKALGLDSKKIAKSMQKDAVGTTLMVLDAINKLPKDEQAAISSKLFGNEARALGPLLTNLGLLRESLGLVANEQQYAGSASKEYEIRSKTFANNLQLFRNRLTAMGIDIGNALLPPLTMIMDKLGPLIDGIAHFAQKYPELTANAIAAASALIGFRIALSGLSYLGLIGKGGALSMLAGSLRMIAGIGSLGTIASDAVALQRALGLMDGMKLTGFQAFVTGARALLFAVPGIGLIAGALGAIGTALAAISAPVWGTIVVVVAALAASGATLYYYWDRVSSVIGGFATRVGQELKPALDAVKPAIDLFGIALNSIINVVDGVMDSLSGFGTWIKSFFQREILSGDQKAAFHQAGYELADAMIEGIKSAFMGLMGWFGGLAGRIVAAVGKIDISGNVVTPAMTVGGGAVHLPATAAKPSGGVPVGPGITIPAKAAGGPIRAGQATLVGEKGPEIITSSKSGTVHPNGTMPPGMGGISIGDVHIHGITDPAAVAREVTRTLAAQAAAALRGVQADYGLKMG